MQGVMGDDAALVKRCLDGQAGAQRELIERFHADVYGLCIRLLTHTQDAEDIAQETFIRVFRSLRSWDSSRPLRPWILRIAVNRCRTLMAQRVKRPELVDYLQETPGREQVDDSIEIVAEIRQALASLRPEYQAVFVMFHEQGCSYEEIAVSHERPVGTIKTWLHRTRLEILTHLRRRGMVPTEMPTDSAPKG
jgi:RNA polymerase sigma factor (sigma-70 family)